MSAGRRLDRLRSMLSLLPLASNGDSGDPIINAAEMLHNGVSKYGYGSSSHFTTFARRPCSKSVFAFFSHKILRGGPRLLLILAICFVFLIFSTEVIPLGSVDLSLHDAYSQVWHWTAALYDEEEERGGGLRIVVFGENDVATPPSEDFYDGRLSSWTELLCAELDCNSYLSFIPSYDTPNNGRISHELYGMALDYLSNETSKSNAAGPGLKYDHLETEYASDWKLDDLVQQVDSFLAMPQAARPPKETLWIFTVGTWDVWALSAMPLAVGGPVIEEMARVVYEQAERLYQASMDPESVAWSDVHSTFQANVTDMEPGVNRTFLGEIFDGDVGAGAAGGKTQQFQIVIPMLLDPSLSPAWREERVALPHVHSKAEQMRNSGILTNRFNAALTRGLTEWIRGPERAGQQAVQGNNEQGKERIGDNMFGKLIGPPHGGPVVTPPEWQQGGKWPPPNPKLDAGVLSAASAANKPATGIAAKHDLPPNISARLPKRSRRSVIPPDAPADSGQPSTPSLPEASDASSSKPLPKRVPPQRDGYIFDYTLYVAEVMTDRQMRDNGISDANGAGKLPVQEGFAQLTACMSTAALESAAAAAAAASADRRANETEIHINIEVEVVNRRNKSPRGVAANNRRGTGGGKGQAQAPPSRAWAMAQRAPVRGAASGGATRAMTEHEVARFSRPAPVDGDKPGASQDLVRTLRTWTAPDLAAAADAAAATLLSPPKPPLSSSDPQEVGEVAKEAVTACAAPNDHLFLSPFLLSQRAVDEIARQGAEMVRRNATMRADWESARLEHEALVAAQTKSG